MRVAIDARKLRDGGIGTYIREVVAAMLARSDAPELVALLDPKDLGRTGWPVGRVTEREARAGKYGLAEHWIVPREARAAGAKLLHAPHYTLPWGWRGPSVVTVHDLIHLRFPHSFPPGAALYARAVAGSAVKRSRIVLADSEVTRRDVIELLNAPAERVRTVPLGVSSTLRRPSNDTIEAFRKARGLPNDFVLYVGARRRHKNLGLLLSALARITPADRPPLVLSGNKWSAEDPLAIEATRLGVAKTVAFSGDLAGEEQLAALYSAASLYAQPALYEGFGLPPLEAMACGTPVLSSTGGSLPEAVGDAAETLPPSDPDAWAEAIGRLLRDVGRRAELAVRGLERAKAFTWEKTAWATLVAYRDVMR